MKERTNRITVTALMCALAYVVMFVLRVPVSFLTYDMKDVVIALAGFLYGPLYSLIIAAVVTVLEMVTVSSTGPYGLIMNFLASAIFSCTAAFIYKRHRSLRGAQAGLAAATFLNTGMMIVFNCLIAPYYLKTTIEGIIPFLMPLILPFNLLKGATNATIISLVYKPFTNTLRKANLMPQRSAVHGASSKKAQIISIVTAVLLLIVCIVLFYFFYLAKKPAA